jgi:hypothetical protein
MTGNGFATKQKRRISTRERALLLEDKSIKYKAGIGSVCPVFRLVGPRVPNSSCGKLFGLDQDSTSDSSSFHGLYLRSIVLVSAAPHKLKTIY